MRSRTRLLIALSSTISTCSRRGNCLESSVKGVGSGVDGSGGDERERELNPWGSVLHK
jgi:hypothetical protein